MGRIEERISELGLKLPEAPAPMGSYLPWTRSGKLVFVSGQLPRQEGKIVYQGRIPTEISAELGKEAAGICALNAVSVLKDAAGDLDKVKQILRMTCWVASSPFFFDQPAIANGASDFLVKVFGEAGKHSRMTTGVIGLPGNATVAVDLVAALK